MHSAPRCPIPYSPPFGGGATPNLLYKNGEVWREHGWQLAARACTAMRALGTHSAARLAGCTVLQLPPFFPNAMHST